MSTKLYSASSTGTTTPEWLDSEHYRFVTGGVTIDAATVTADGAGVKSVPSGTAIEKQGNGKWKPAAATPAAGAYVALLWETVNVTAGDVATGAIDHGRVIAARLPVSVVAAHKTAMPQITFR